MCVRTRKCAAKFTGEGEAKGIGHSRCIHTRSTCQPVVSLSHHIVAECTWSRPLGYSLCFNLFIDPASRSPCNSPRIGLPPATLLTCNFSRGEPFPAAQGFLRPEKQIHEALSSVLVILTRE